METLLLSHHFPTHTPAIQPPPTHTYTSTTPAPPPLHTSFYPLYPPAPGVPLDAALAPALHLDHTPDILILPSELAPFAKMVHLPETHPGAGDAAAVLVVNPGVAGKRAGLGTAAMVVVGPHGEAAAVAGGQPSSTNGAVGHAVESRARVKVEKL